MNDIITTILLASILLSFAIFLIVLLTPSRTRKSKARAFLALEITESVYRPFKNQEECWNEMLKHQPFGWVSSKNKNVMTFICYISNDSVQIHDGCTFHGWNFNYEEMFDKYIFADGTPFGIKEE